MIDDLRTTGWCLRSIWLPGLVDIEPALIHQIMTEIPPGTGYDALCNTQLATALNPSIEASQIQPDPPSSTWEIP